MNSKITKSGEKRAEHHAFAQLLKQGVLPYRTAGGCLWVNTPMGCRLELRAVLSTRNSVEEERRFVVADFRPHPELFFLCVEFDGDEITAVWVLPSTAFFVYSTLDEERGLRELNLDANQERIKGIPLREYCSYFRNRWEPVTQFDLYRRFMKSWDSPDFADGWENFEDEMMALEVIENREPRSESIPIEEIVFSGTASLAG